MQPNYDTGVPEDDKEYHANLKKKESIFVTIHYRKEGGKEGRGVGRKGASSRLLISTIQPGQILTAYTRREVP